MFFRYKGLVYWVKILIIKNMHSNGLCFIPVDIQIPPSLVNIFKELYQDLGIQKIDGDLTCDGAKQGVLLLNSSLSVRESLCK